MNRRLLPIKLISIMILAILSGIPFLQAQTNLSGRIQCWLTDPDRQVFFQEEKGLDYNLSGTTVKNEIVVNPQKVFQTIDGFGFALTGGSAALIHRMEAPARKALLEELFGTKGKAIGTSYLRISIGASDLDDHVFSYDDLPTGETDTLMQHFSLDPDRQNLIPVLKEILTIFPEIKILGSPWSPPVWMKTNAQSKGGSLKQEYYPAYARYFVKYIKGMEKEGIPIDAITIQNEPLHPGNNPSMLMLPEEQALFIRSALGPAFRDAGLKTKIIVYDHNPNRTDYALTVLSDPEAAKYVDGSAFHMYQGEVDAIGKVHDAFPAKNLYFTEQWVGAPGNMKGDIDWHVRTLIIGATRNWCRNVIEWNLAADPYQDPHTEGGCTSCLGAVTIDGDTVTRNPAYYIIAHAARFVRPGSVRIESNLPAKLPNVAFMNPSGERVLIVMNEASDKQQFNVKDGQRKFILELKPGAVVTMVW